jgi:hypothetical protein
MGALRARQRQREIAASANNFRIAYKIPSLHGLAYDSQPVMKPGSKIPGYEPVSQPVAPLHRYVRRQLRSLGIGLVFIAIGLYIGMLGYHYIVGLSWIDAYENAAMILSGMGPLAAPSTFAGKLFSGSYALFSGIAVLAIAGVIAAPLVHRFLHRLHADSSDRR